MKQKILSVLFIIMICGNAMARGDIYKLQGDTESAARDYAQALQYNTTIHSYGNCRQFAFLALGQVEIDNEHKIIRITHTR